MYYFCRNIPRYCAIGMTVLSLSLPVLTQAQSAQQAQKVTQKCMQSRDTCTRGCQSRQKDRKCVLTCTDVESQCIKKVVNTLKK